LKNKKNMSGNEYDRRKEDGRIDKMYRALFGEEDTDNVGVVAKVDDMHRIFIRMGNGLSFVKWLVSALILLGVFWGTIKGVFIAIIHEIIKVR